jgi:hypothetical protein
MKRTLSIMFAALALSAPAVNHAHAMDYTYKVDTFDNGKSKNDYLVIFAKGEIDYKEEDAFDKFLKSLPAKAAAQETVVVAFDSQGGNVYGAYGVGERIRKAGWRTAVEDEATCASACVIAWGASPQKFASSTAKVGVHSITMDSSKMTDKSSLKESDDVYAAVFTLAAAAQLKAYGAPDNVVVKAMITDKADLYWLNGDDAKAWNVTITQPRPKALGTPTASIN